MKNSKNQFKVNEQALINDILTNGKQGRTWFEIAQTYNIRPDVTDPEKRKKSANDVWRRYNRIAHIDTTPRAVGLTHLTSPTWQIPHYIDAVQALQGKLVSPQTIKPKRLFYDIETSYNIVKSWRVGYNLSLQPEDIIKERAIITIAYKWEGEDDVTVLSWDKGDDKRIITEFVKIMSEADELVGHNCVSSNTKILKNNLDWIKAKDLKIGDELVGFEENAIGTRKYKKSIVTGHEIKKAITYRVFFDDTSYVDVTEDHQWLGLAPKDNQYRWRKTSELSVGYRMPKPFNVWEEKQDYNSGYLAGIIEADGSITKDNYYGISIYQSQSKNKDIFDKIIKTLDKENINYNIDNIETSKIISTTYKGQEGVIQNQIDTNDNVIRILGSSNDKIELIGKYNIQKGKRNFCANNMGYLKVPVDRLRVITNIVKLQEEDIVVMQTSEKTFIANGYLMHNCDRFDTKFIMGRALKHGITVLPKYQSTDTLKLAKKHFMLNSNKLDYIAQYLDLGHKVRHRGMSMWDDIILNNCPKALEEMIEYNIHDVVLTEQVYKKLSEYSLPKVNHASKQTGEKHTCPQCGSIEASLQKTYVTSSGTKTRLMLCNSCSTSFTVNNTNYEKYYNGANAK